MRCVLLLIVVAGLNDAQVKLSLTRWSTVNKGPPVHPAVLKSILKKAEGPTYQPLTNHKNDLSPIQTELGTMLSIINLKNKNK